MRFGGYCCACIDSSFILPVLLQVRSLPFPEDAQHRPEQTDMLQVRRQLVPALRQWAECETAAAAATGTDDAFTLSSFTAAADGIRK